MAVAWVLPDEGDATIDALLADVATGGALVPGLWPLEIANVLLIAERRGRITLAERRQALSLLADLPIRIEPHTAARARAEILALAETCKLTVYDASYLDVAIRHALPLASRDEALRKAAIDCGVAVLG